MASTILILKQARVRLMHQSRWLQAVILPLSPQIVSSKTAQFLVNQWKYLAWRQRISLHCSPHQGGNRRISFEHGKCFQRYMNLREGCIE